MNAEHDHSNFLRDNDARSSTSQEELRRVLDEADNSLALSAAWRKSPDTSFCAAEETITQLEEALKNCGTALLAALAKVDRLHEALKPFAYYACDPPCGCHNCAARTVLGDTK